MSVQQVSSIIKLTEKTSGRDKLCRLVQYGSKFVYWVLEQESLSPELVTRLKALESSISTARKLFRLGTSFTQFRAALDTIHMHDAMLRFLVTLTKLNRGFYLLIDHLVWANRMNLLTIDSQYWSRRSNQFWLLALFLGLLRDLYELLRAWSAERERMRQYQSYESVSMKAVCSVLRNNPATCVDVVKNCGDFLIPFSRLDLLYLPGGIVGLLGVVSSVAGLVATYNERLKLKYS